MAHFLLPNMAQHSMQRVAHFKCNPHIITKEIKVIFNAFAKSMTLGRSIRIENLIYILGVNDIYLHIFDIEKRGIIWSFMHPEKTRINDISIYKDKIYLKDWNDNLLILEREE